MAKHPILRIGTRGSPLALAQAHEVRDRLITIDPSLGDEGVVEIVVIKTTGDKVQDRTLVEIGGKGLFTKEIEEALRDGRIDLAVHSMKDMPTWLPDGLTIPCLLPREDPRDALIANEGTSLSTLPKGSVFGTSSLRRQAQVKALRPDIKVVPLRGNVQTRLRKLREGAVDATVLALSGLKRVNLQHIASSVLSVEEMLPAVAQGAIGIECRSEDAHARSWLALLNDDDTQVLVDAERALLAALDGSCRTPIAGLAQLEPDGMINLHGMIASPGGDTVLTAGRRGLREQAVALGTDAGEELRRRAGNDFERWQAGIVSRWVELKAGGEVPAGDPRILPDDIVNDDMGNGDMVGEQAEREAEQEAEQED